ncbi:MAG: carboxypeptidase regulatory-like domain-containing protein [Planctomycetes bacterium]|nr:carboxypeptidase regulatory-like domain-containing protein [Planctomycetota bacterium]
MKLAPTILVLAAFGVLLWVSSQRPVADGSTTAAENASPHAASPYAAPPHAAAGHSDPQGATGPSGHAGATEFVKSIPATPLLPPPRSPDSIVVQIRDSAGNGQPQIDVTLEDVAGKAIATRRSDAGGRAAFEHVAAGRYSVIAHDPDYLYTARNRATVEAKKGVVADIEVRVDRGTAGLRGQLVDGNEAPLAERRVNLSAGGAESSVNTLSVNTFSVNTDAKGRFLVNGLAPGDWTVSPEGFEAQKRTVKLTDGATAEAVLKLAKSAAMRIELSGSHLNPAHFQGGEKAFVRRVGGASTTPLAHEMERLTDGGHEHANVLRTSFAGLAAGNYEIEILDAKGASLLHTGAAWSQAIPVALLEGDDRALPLKTTASGRGGGVTVPSWAIIMMCVVIGGLVFVTPVIFPAPVIAKRPLGLQR